LADIKKCSVDLSCNTTATCKLCSDGYALKDGYCLKCTYTDSNCTTCLSTNLQLCAKCITGFYLKSGACSKCADYCLACVGQAACSKCTDGYYLVLPDGSATGTCAACSTDCKTCSGIPSSCTSCYDKYVLEGSKCISVNRAVLSLVLGMDMGNMVDVMD
jgi:hypothetical protein